MNAILIHILRHAVGPLICVMMLTASCRPDEKAASDMRSENPTVNASETPPSSPVFDASIVEKGGSLFAQISAKTPQTKLDVWGTASPSVKACLWIVEDDWKALSVDERNALVIWLQAKIPTIRKEPTQFIGIDQRAPAYKRILRNIVNMRDGAFVVFTMVQKDGDWIQGATVAESK
jgi:hypothetical protein